MDVWRWAIIRAGLERHGYLYCIRQKKKLLDGNGFIALFFFFFLPCQATRGVTLDVFGLK